MSSVAQAQPAPIPKVAEACRLKDGRVGVVSQIEGPGITVRVLNAQTKKVETIQSTASGISRPASCEPGKARFTHDAKTRETLAAYFLSDGGKTLYPHLQDLSKVELVTQHRDRWMDFNCIANSVGIRNEFVFPKKSLQEQDEFYRRHGFVPHEGPVTPGAVRPQEGVEKVLVYAFDENSAPRHAAVQDADGLWDNKLGQGVHIRVANPFDLNGEDAGCPVRLYVRARK